MPYRISPDDPSLQAALRRIAGEELAAALAPLGRGRLAPDEVHDIRKRIKKVRGLMRMVQGSFPAFDPENAALRDAGRMLAAHRDAAVRLATFDRLFPDGPDALAPLRARLVEEREAAHAGPDPAQAEPALRALETRARRWSLKGDDAAILRRGLARTRRRCAGAMRDASTSPDAEAMHRWRKRAKDFWYQTRLLAPLWPQALTPLAEAASSLTEDLGIHHDIEVLVQHARPGLLTDAAMAQLAQTAHAAQRRIEVRVFAEGRRLFAGDPEEMAKLWGRWWALWRDQPTSAPDSPRSISATVSSTP